MRYATFTDIHANLEALEAVLAKIDEITQEEPIDEIWFLGDLVGYGPNPNECIVMLRERTDVMIAGNHDWAAVGKIEDRPIERAIVKVHEVADAAEGQPVVKVAHRASQDQAQSGTERAVNDR